LIIIDFPVTWAQLKGSDVDDAENDITALLYGQTVVKLHLDTEVTDDGSTVQVNV
jgi:hypothetical protein